MKSGFLYLFLFVFTLSCTPEKPEGILDAEQHLPEIVDYNYHIKPILSDRCYKCHGPDDNTREAGLRFDVEEDAKALLEESGNRALVPGSLRKSEVFHRLVTDDEEMMMPPPESNLHITDEEKAYILKWIEQGAEYKEHWSFIPPQKIAPPQSDNMQWGANEIDGFVLAGLEERGMQPAEEASKETLIRRLSFDLTGLPPTIEDIDAFLADNSEDAYKRVVDRLLDSKAYGERMAAEWMDVSRYADSHGYQDDGMRNMWPWRNWVIDSFNDNQPFDAFLTWQLAGDLLPDPTKEQILATAFNRNHMQSQEGGVVEEEYRVEYVADRTNTLGKAFMGLTLECARCHDHKFDPVSQKEYYQLFGYFNNINEIGVIPYAGEASPTVILSSPEAEIELEELESQIKSLEEKIDINNQDYDAGFSDWLDTLTPQSTISLPALVGHFPLDAVDDFQLVNNAMPDKPASVAGDREEPLQVVEGKFAGAIELNGASWFSTGRDDYAFERNESFSFSLWINVQKDSVAGPIIGRSYSLFDGNRGYMLLLNEDGTLSASLNHVAPDNSIEIRSEESVYTGTWHHIVMTYDGSSRAAGIQLYLDGKKLNSKTIVDNLKKSILYTYNFYKDEQTNWTSTSLRLGMVGPNQTHTEDVYVDELRIYADQLSTLEVQQLAGIENPLGDIAAHPSNTWTKPEKEALRAYFVMHFERDYKRAKEQLLVLRGRQNEIITPQQEVMVMRERKEKRPTFFLDRGAYDAPREEVKNGTPQVLPAFKENAEQNRLGLASWLTDPAHPLTARVAVNRYWQQIFGEGLVATPDDFGSQGSLPSHPELLDWLAVDFMESGWDVKRMLKQIVLSATYRQSSVASPEVLERDPSNTYLARGPSYRMTAEMIRDNALAVSGLLVKTIGGPSVHPYQPAGLWKELATRNETEYKQDQGDKLYRRSMYTIWKRSTPPPAMISFDASERNVCIVERQKTSSPLQALILLNDPQYIEAARVLAERMMKAGGANIDEQIVFAFRLLTSRFPEDHEKDLLKRLYTEELANFTTNKEEAEALLAVGEYPRDQSLPPPEVAARTLTASTIMNFDEAYMKR